MVISTVECSDKSVSGKKANSPTVNSPNYDRAQTLRVAAVPQWSQDQAENCLGKPNGFDTVIEFGTLCTSEESEHSGSTSVCAAKRKYAEIATHENTTEKGEPSFSHLTEDHCAPNHRSDAFSHSKKRARQEDMNVQNEMGIDTAFVVQSAMPGQSCELLNEAEHGELDHTRMVSELLKAVDYPDMANATTRILPEVSCAAKGNGTMELCSSSEATNPEEEQWRVGRLPGHQGSHVRPEGHAGHKRSLGQVSGVMTICKRN